MPARTLTWLLMAGTLGVYPSAVFAQQPAPVPAVPPVQTTPAVPPPTVAAPPTVAPTPPAAPVQATPPATPLSPPTPVTPPAPAVPVPPNTPVQQNGQAPTQPGIAVPEVQVIQPEPVKPKVVVPKEAAAPKRKPVQAAAPAPQPVQAAPKPVTAVAPKPAPVPVAVQQAEPVAVPQDAVTQVKLSPIGGSEIAIEKVAGAVSTVSAADVTRSGATSLQEVLQAKVPGVTLNDLQGSGFQTDVQYRGFSASPLDGVAQGLAVYQNGVRINESFGDTVNLDFLPSNAISDIAVMGSNPAFGLNALGGSISIGMKDGFNYHGGEIDARAGSFGRRQGSVQAGVQSGPAALYFAYEDIAEHGWRDNSPAHIRRFYGDIGFKSDGNEMHFNLTRANNFYGVVAAAPVELLSQGGWGRTYTSPQTTVNDVLMPTVNATIKLDDATKFSGVGYYRRFSQRHVDGNLTNASDCGDGTLCIDGPGTDQVLDQNGNPISAALTGEIDRTSVDSDSYGVSGQVVNKSKLFGLNNQFLIGASVDHGDVGDHGFGAICVVAVRFSAAQYSRHQRLCGCVLLERARCDGRFDGDRRRPFQLCADQVAGSDRCARGCGAQRYEHLRALQSQYRWNV